MNPIDRYRTDGLASQSPQRLLVLLYQRLGADLDRAEAALLANDLGTAHVQLVHAQDIVTELHLALDTKAWPEGDALEQLYRYLSEQLVLANVRKSGAIVGQCRQLVTPLIEAWEQAYRSAHAAAGEPVGQGRA